MGLLSIQCPTPPLRPGPSHIKNALNVFLSDLYLESSCSTLLYSTLCLLFLVYRLVMICFSSPKILERTATIIGGQSGGRCALFRTLIHSCLFSLANLACPLLEASRVSSYSNTPRQALLDPRPSDRSSISRSELSKNFKIRGVGMR